MSLPERIDYKVVLVFPGYGDERENAEEVIEAALEYLNTQKDEPGFRFAYHVFASLDIVPDLDDAQIRLETDDSVALFILHDLEDEERIAFTHECAAQGVPVCHTIPASDQPESRPRPSRRKNREWQVVIRKRSEDDEPVAHKILDTTLTAPIEDDQDVIMDRVGQLIAVMALGVMEYHWRNNPPSRMMNDE